VEESRILQVSIFNTLQNNLDRVDFSKVLLDVITIADEVDSQLKQAVLSYVEPGPAVASQPNRKAGVRQNLDNPWLLVVSPPDKITNRTER
jgi:hypothetical protein